MAAGGAASTSTAPAANLGSPAQIERRARILDAAEALASEGGYDAVQMREIAERAGVALGTLYRYFPSKNHLLVSALDREFDRVEQYSANLPVPGDTPHARMMFVFERTAQALEDDPRLTEALTRAFVFADESVEQLIDQVGTKLVNLIGRTMSGDPKHVPTAEEADMVHIIGDVWLASLIAWATGRKTPAGVLRSMDTAIRLLLR